MNGFLPQDGDHVKLIVAVLGLAAALIGLFAAFVNRKKVIVHKNIAESTAYGALEYPTRDTANRSKYLVKSLQYACVVLVIFTYWYLIVHDPIYRQLKPVFGNWNKRDATFSVYLTIEHKDAIGTCIHQEAHEGIALKRAGSIDLWVVAADENRLKVNAWGRHNEEYSHVIDYSYNVAGGLLTIHRVTTADGKPDTNYQLVGTFVRNR